MLNGVGKVQYRSPSLVDGLLYLIHRYVFVTIGYRRLYQFVDMKVNIIISSISISIISSILLGLALAIAIAIAG